jgi:hypothetical protein
MKKSLKNSQSQASPAMHRKPITCSTKKLLRVTHFHIPSKVDFTKNRLAIHKIATKEADKDGKKAKPRPFQAKPITWLHPNTERLLTV